MNLLLAVVEDLSLFAYGSVRTLFLSSAKIENPERVIGAPAQYVVLPASTETGGERTVVAHRTLMPQVSGEATPKHIQKSTVMYTSSVATALRSAPGVLGDTVYTVLPYGSLVMVLEVRDMWAQVASGTYVGWVYVDDLEDRAAHVYPSFHIEEENLADDPATLRLRAIIQDEFGAGEMGLPLQAEEYVLYRLYRKELRIEWPQIRPRTPGTWHEILHTTPGVTVANEPKAGSVMEFLVFDEMGKESWGHMAYVDAVFPDDSIQISEANWPDDGRYNERVLVREEWQGLNPSFLIFS